MDPCERAIELVYRSRYLRFKAVLATVTGNNETARDAVQLPRSARRDGGAVDPCSPESAHQSQRPQAPLPNVMDRLSHERRSRPRLLRGLTPLVLDWLREVLAR